MRFLALFCTAFSRMYARASGSAQVAREPYAINALVPLTAAAHSSKRLQRSSRGCRNHRQPNWGIQGRPLKFALSDTQTNPQVALQLVTGSSQSASPSSSMVALPVFAVHRFGCSQLRTSRLLPFPGVHPPAGATCFLERIDGGSSEDTWSILSKPAVGRIWV